jgi:beta-lactamase class D
VPLDRELRAPAGSIARRGAFAPTMRALTLFLACAGLAGCAAKPATAAPTVTIDHPGCFLLYDLASGEQRGVGPESCAHALVPASTFKIPHALIALETGVIEDPDAKVPWDGTKQWLPAWEQSHSLATAIRESVVWFFQRTAVAIGKQRMQEFLTAMRYGNADVRGSLTLFWLDDGSLRITGDQQLEFLVRLFRRELAIERRHVDTLERMMLTDAALMRERLPDDVPVPVTRASIHAKTGTAQGVSWWVGRVTGPGGDFVFVSRVESDLAPGRKSLAMAAGVAALRQAGAL